MRVKLNAKASVGMSLPALDMSALKKMPVMYYQSSLLTLAIQSFDAQI